MTKRPEASDGALSELPSSTTKALLRGPPPMLSMAIPAIVPGLDCASPEGGAATAISPTTDTRNPNRIRDITKNISLQLRPSSGCGYRRMPSLWRVQRTTVSHAVIERLNSPGVDPAEYTSIAPISWGCMKSVGESSPIHTMPST